MLEAGGALRDRIGFRVEAVEFSIVARTQWRIADDVAAPEATRQRRVEQTGGVGARSMSRRRRPESLERWWKRFVFGVVSERCRGNNSQAGDRIYFVHSGTRPQQSRNADRHDDHQHHWKNRDAGVSEKHARQ